jgi:Zn-dependent peptidase ImmA (M78 family)
MTKFIPYLAEEMIERDAAALLAEYGQARGVSITPPIPIEEIIEKHLKLGVEFDDAHNLFGVPRSGRDPDIIGALLLDEARIVIDESLDPEENPSKETRYRFTLAHEGGHWRLHRDLFAKDPAQANLFGGAPVRSVVCRSSQAKERVEWQADFYASCMLMPRKLVMSAWEEKFGTLRPHIMDRSRRVAAVKIRDLEEEWQNHLAMEDFARPFAQQFLVSPQAMRIRLEKLGLLHPETPRQPMLSGA